MLLDEFLAEWNNESPTLLVHTSGSTGRPKPMYVEKRRMTASARITCDFLGLHAGDTALLCMPLDFIAGKMMVVRALTCGLTLKAVEPTGKPLWEGPVDFAAMVPMQVWNLLHGNAEERERVMQIRHLIIGGGAIDDALEAQLQQFPHAVWSTYGMTETLSHVALRRLNGPDVSPWYTPFESVSVRLNADGCLVIDAPAVCSAPLTTNDLAELAPDGRRFRIIGRRDNVVCSGGIKIQIEEVERTLKPHLDDPFMVSKRKDERFGEALVLLLESKDVDSAREVCRRVLPRYWQPRNIVSVTSLPLTATGKPDRAAALQLAKN